MTPSVAGLYVRVMNNGLVNVVRVEVAVGIACN